ncbi:hypothetical protein LCGC14_1134680, partial [marine sediment metagenome]
MGSPNIYNSDDLIPFLERIKKAYGVPLAVVSD